MTTAPAPRSVNALAPAAQPSRPFPLSRRAAANAAIPPWRWPLLLAAGAGAFALASAFAPRDAQVAMSEPVLRASGAARAPRTEVAAPLTLPLRAPIADKPAADPFIAPSFAPPPPPAPPPAVAVAPPPPAPTAPPLPFSFVGLLEKGAAKPAAFIAKGDALLVVSAGDVIDGTYRVESLSESAIVLTYLPLNQQQSLAVAGGSK